MEFYEFYSRIISRLWWKIHSTLGSKGWHRLVHREIHQQCVDWKIQSSMSKCCIWKERAKNAPLPTHRFEKNNAREGTFQKRTADYQRKMGWCGGMVLWINAKKWAKCVLFRERGSPSSMHLSRELPSKKHKTRSTAALSHKFGICARSKLRFVSVLFCSANLWSAKTEF